MKDTFGLVDCIVGPGIGGFEQFAKFTGRDALVTCGVPRGGPLFVLGLLAESVQMRDTVREAGALRGTRGPGGRASGHCKIVFTGGAGFLEGAKGFGEVFAVGGGSSERLGGKRLKGLKGLKGLERWWGGYGQCGQGGQGGQCG